MIEVRIATSNPSLYIRTYVPDNATVDDLFHIPGVILPTIDVHWTIGGKPVEDVRFEPVSSFYSHRFVTLYFARKCDGTGLMWDENKREWILNYDNV